MLLIRIIKVRMQRSILLLLEFSCTVFPFSCHVFLIVLRISVNKNLSLKIGRGTVLPCTYGTTKRIVGTLRLYSFGPLDL